MFLSNFLSNFTLSRGKAFIWDSKIKKLKIITHFRFIDLDLLIGIERQKKTIYDNTINFAEGNFTNNALLWGSRGNGKSSLIKSNFTEISITSKLPSFSKLILTSAVLPGSTDKGLVSTDSTLNPNTELENKTKNNMKNRNTD